LNAKKISFTSICSDIDSITANLSNSVIYSACPFLSKQNIWIVYNHYIKSSRSSLSMYCYSIIRYYMFVISSFISYTIQFIVWRLSGQKFNSFCNTNCIIDSYVLYAPNENYNDVLDGYLPGLIKELEKKSINSVTIPRLPLSLKIIHLYKYYKFLKDKSLPVLSLYQNFSFVGFYNSFLLSIIYPFKILIVIIKSKNTKSKKFLYFYFFKTLISPVYCFVTYYSYLKLKNSFNRKISLIQWSENQNIDRTINLCVNLFYNDCKIIGTQFFLQAPECVNYKYSSSTNMLYKPSKLFVNGLAYCGDNNNVNVGPSFRYQWIFNINKIYSTKNTNILVLLPYWQDLSNSILSFICNLDSRYKFTLKLHPASSKQFLVSSSLSKFHITSKPLSDLIYNHMLIIGNSSGALLEGLACGIPVAQYSCKNYAEFNFLPQKYQGVLWGDFVDLPSLTNIIHYLISYKEKNTLSIRNAVNSIRSEYFTRYSDSLLNNVLE
jgi:hypothetical protein